LTVTGSARDAPQIKGKGKIWAWGDMNCYRPFDGRSWCGAPSGNHEFEPFNVVNGGRADTTAGTANAALTAEVLPAALGTPFDHP
jgi:hypothetical protein